ncbi:MAG: alanine--tRNA ligase [Bdellovibrionota bacterium]
MKTEDIRNAFLRFFESKGHTIVNSSSLVPAGDPTLLFTNAGMVQFKDCFLGTDKRAYTRATTCQKSLRISGKHNDLENVGRTARHHTFFEMLGNFSFGDYFKQDAIKYAWEFVTEVLGLPKNRLWVTVYEEDDEAAELWAANTDVPKERILRFGKDDNFWAMGETGPCGPCSEIFVYLGDNIAGQSEQEFRHTDGLYIEIWNLVFMQFNRNPKGELTPLPKPSVDTGMGLERVAAVKQGVRSNYDIDSIRRIITLTEQLSGKSYVGHDYTARDTETDQQYAVDVAMRVIADHSRAATFLIADGVNPASDGRGYVLRRLIRRACRHGRVLGFTKPFLFQAATEVVAVMGDAYPEIRANEAKIAKIIRAEEEKFLVTLDTGIGILNTEIQTVKSRSSKVLPGEIAFLLHDTYGFPLDLTEDLARTQGLTVDSDGFSASMEKQRERSRAARASDTELILQRSVKPQKTEFVGYEFTEYESNVLSLFDASGEISSAKAGQEIVVLAKETPFYAESGGQVGDTGTITCSSATLDVVDTQKVGGDTIAHICRVTEGEIAPGANVRLAIDAARRQRLRVNHSATHLLHLALREVLGDHVKQAGSRVSDRTLRFDFSHFEPITPEQLREIETIANQQIQANHAVTTQLMPVEEAKRSGAMALFGEKYGSTVRVVQIGPRSRELCGGTHASRSGDLGLLTILSEGSISAGVRRVEATAGAGALQTIAAQKQLLAELGELLKTSERDLTERVSKMLEHQRTLEKEASRLDQIMKAEKSADLTKHAFTLPNGTRVVASVIDDATPKQLREVADNLRERLGSGCIALATVNDGKAVLLTAVTKDLVDRYHAGTLMQELAKVVGSRGGGKADLAQAGGGDPTKIDQALKRFQELLQ